MNSTEIMYIMIPVIWIIGVISTINDDFWNK